MLTGILVLFAAVAVVGLTMAIGHFRGRATPVVPLAVLHGLVAAAGLVWLLMVVVGPDDAGAPVKVALGLFVLAAIGGFTLALGYHVRKRRLSSGLIIVHGGVAVVAFLVLLAAALGLL
jgi:hypothetical protein